MTPPRQRPGSACLSRPLWGAVLSVGVALALSLSALPALADDLEDFEAARTQYDAQHFEVAVRLFEDLVLVPVPRVRNVALRLESRKYLGAAYLFMGRGDEARDQFRQLLEEDPAYTLDPLSFPAAVQTAFDEARAQLEARQREAERAAAERLDEEERQRLLRMAAEQERLRHLEELANYETIVLPNSRALATVPFGVGQFRNGNRIFGATLAVGQLALLAGSLGTYIGHRSLLAISAQCTADPSNCALDVSPPGGPRTPEELQFIDRERRVRVSNYILTGGFVALMLVGIIEAHVNFVPERRQRRLRLGGSEALAGQPGRNDGVAPITLSVQLGLGSAGLITRF
ncbi:MAG: hypothetical protein IPG17_07955 [Sandaracinaceae bacterium]|nr:hypothetical protein [Sandaracinaceae bacterium]